MTTQTDGKAAFEEAIDHAKQSGMVVDGFVPGDDTDIAALEIRLGVRLPPSYKAVVR
ncbi:SMI1/KNR4 family protein [Antarcticirhabdus aurantiaca]|uniref:SMI1/KNR4 family protein n=1 Tax=Antarcticirhabdus aurantiaca TaxID=2606717 RepID=A0ACD4NMZ9_9HYPH|nr:SMI1/KNR4 family protein [Antarcticirhabdus aurantiaca]WAJ28236.1 SMI1/KNR4 family protein [Jeongeuplla avenae]